MTLNHRIDGPAEGRVLLMVGSLGTNLAMWERQLPLAERLRLVRIDLRGHGGSPVPRGPYTMEDLGRDVLALMDELGLERASYCGLSIGGMVGMWLAAAAPERVERLVLVCTSAHMPPAASWQERARTVRAADSVEPLADTVLDRWLTPGFASQHPEVRAELRAMLVSTPAEGYAGCCEAIERMDLRPELPRISAPTLVVSGRDDPSTPVEMQRAIAEAVPGARHEIVGPAAHISAIERPQEINQLIEEHMR